MALAPIKESESASESFPSVHHKETSQQNDPKQNYRQKLLISMEAEYAATETAYEQLDSVQRKNRLDALSECRSSAWYAVHLQSGLVRVLSSSCRLRWCPMSAKFLTLTLKHSDEDLSTQIIRLYACFSVLRRRVFINRSIRAGVWFFQIKWSEKSQQWHPHLHCVLDADFMPHKTLKALWKSVTGDSDIVDIRAVRDPSKVAEYVARYAARPCELAGLTNLQRLQVLLAMHGRRLCGKWGDADDLQLSRSSANIQDDYIIICPFSDLLRLSKISFFAESVRSSFVSGAALVGIKSRADLESRVELMYCQARGVIRPPPPVVEPVFSDGDGSWLYRRYS